MKMIRRFALASGLLIASAAFAPSAFAGTATATLSVTLSVTNSCTLAATSVNFGNHNGLTNTSNTTITAIGTLTPTCTCTSTNPVITLGDGLNGLAGNGSTPPSRNLSDGNGHLIPYQLYTDNNHQYAWVDSSGTQTSNNVITVNNLNNQKPIMIYGQIGNNVAIPTTGTYTDTITATITY